ncbi:hypothetical protein BDW68DRAFT_192579 [Aspergillus falconensis]
MLNHMLYQLLQAYIDEKSIQEYKIKVYKYKSLLVYTIVVLGYIISLWAAAIQPGSRTGAAADDDLGLIMEDPGSTNSIFSLKIYYNITAPEYEMEFTIGQFQGFIHIVLFDNPSKDVLGWSFLQDPCTPWPLAGGTWLVDWMVWEPAVARAFLMQGAVAQFKEKLAHCNIFVEDSIVVFVTAYHKGFHASNNIKIIHHKWFRELLKWESQMGMGLQHPFNIELDRTGDIMDEEPSHTAHMAGMVYGWESTGLADSTTTRRLGKQANPWEQQ